MKKTILAMMLVGSSCAVFAQNEPANRNTGTNSGYPNSTMVNSSSYNAYGTYTATPPDYVAGYVLRDYPTATDIIWQQNADWWHGYYLYNDMPTHMYYNTAGQNFTVSLPVHQTLIPEMVISKANQMWGPTVYDITAIKGSNGQDVYHVRTIENGMVSDQWIDENGNKTIDIFRVENMSSGMSQDNTDMNQTTDMNAGMNTDNSTQLNAADASTAKKMKIKTESSDGKEIKTKIKNGKIVKEKKS